MLQLDKESTLAEEFKMNKRFDSKGAFLIQLKHFLHKAFAADKKVLLIVDEAHRLNHDLLEQIRLLSNIEMNNRKLINIFFVGQTEFTDMLRQDRNKAIRQRISVTFHIEPLTENETWHYIRHRLKIAGTNQEIFHSKAVQEIYSFSQGYPRLINIICDHALLTEVRFATQETHIHTTGAERVIANRTNGSGRYTDYRGKRVIGVYHWLPELDVALLTEQDEGEALAGLSVGATHTFITPSLGASQLT